MFLFPRNKNTYQKSFNEFLDSKCVQIFCLSIGDALDYDFSSLQKPRSPMCFRVSWKLGFSETHRNNFGLLCSRILCVSNSWRIPKPIPFLLSKTHRVPGFSETETSRRYFYSGLQQNWTTSERSEKSGKTCKNRRFRDQLRTILNNPSIYGNRLHITETKTAIGSSLDFTQKTLYFINSRQVLADFYSRRRSVYPNILFVVEWIRSILL